MVKKNRPEVCDIGAMKAEPKKSEVLHKAASAKSQDIIADDRRRERRIARACVAHLDDLLRFATPPVEIKTEARR